MQDDEEVFENTEEMEVDLCALINETFRIDNDYYFSFNIKGIRFIEQSSFILKVSLIRAHKSTFISSVFSNTSSSTSLKLFHISRMTLKVYKMMKKCLKILKKWKWTCVLLSMKLSEWTTTIGSMNLMPFMLREIVEWVSKTTRIFVRT